MQNDAIILMLLGACALAGFIIGLFFLRFWQTTRDAFFLCFAAAFCGDGIERVLVGAIPHSDEQDPIFYLLRLLSFLIILYAILYKNRMMKKNRPPDL